MNVAIVVSAALLAAGAPSTQVYLKAAAASAPGCRTTPVDAQTVAAGLFAKEAEECPVAKVADEVVVLRELAAVLEASHLARSPNSPAPATRPQKDFRPSLDRLVNARLFVLEAREMQLDQAPEFRDELEAFKQSRLRTMLQESVARGVKADPAEVERLYRDAVREWKISSAFLEKEEDAKAFVSEARAGKSFEALAKKSLADKKGTGDGKSQWVPRKKMKVEILEAVRGAKQGQTLEPVRLASGWVVLRVDGVRYPKDPAVRENARAQSVARLQYEAVRNFYLGLVKQYAVTDEKVLASIDYEAGGEKEFRALMEDPRVVVAIRGDRPITVGDLSKEVATKFFHGIDGPIKEHKVNPQKKPALERLLGTRLFDREAAARKLAARPEYRREVTERERAMLFATFVEKVIVPGVEVPEADAKAWYDAHRKDYTSPEMLKLDGFAFEKSADAQVALGKLKDGTDFGWLRTNAVGQVPPERRTLQLDGSTVSVATLNPELAKALAGARRGEYRLYGAGDAEFYVIRVVEQSPPATKPYADVSMDIVRKLHGQKVDAAIAEYAAKLRKLQKIDVLLTRVAT
jgi:hypothetical protein